MLKIIGLFMNSELIISVVYETKWCMRILLAADLKINRFNKITKGYAFHISLSK